MIRLKNICKNYGDKIIYNNFNLDIEENKITAILGESGAGKTTLLNIIGGLTPYSGEIIGNITPVARVFQKDRLVPHLTVKETLKLINPDIDVRNALAEMDLLDCENAYPKELSAGMARRVALIRAFSFPAKLILMDEPFINLDLSLKYKLFEQIKKLQKDGEKTVITVTHDVKEAAMTADTALVLNGGEIIYREETITENTEKNLTEILLKKI